MNIKEVLFKLDDFCNANKIEYIVIGTAFEKSGMAEYVRNNKEAADKLQSAMVIAAKELVKTFSL